VLALANFTCLIAFAVHDAKGNVASRSQDIELPNAQEDNNGPITVVYDGPSTRK